jgi:hypothetical protein
MQQTQVFPASARAKRAISRAAYLFFVVGVGLLVCVAIAFGVSIAQPEPPTAQFRTAVAGVGCAGLAGLLVGIATLVRLRQPIQVEVSPYRLIWREGRRTATLEYDEVERVEMVKGHKKLRGGFEMDYPIVRFVEDDDEVMEFECSFEDRGLIHQSRFDTQAITSIVLRYLPDTAIVDQAVGEFVQTGMVDIDRLAEQ